MNTPSGFEFDPSSRKSRGNPESAAAWDKIQPANAEECMKVLALLKDRANSGITGKELAKAMDKEFNAVSERLSQLKDAGYAEAVDETPYKRVRRDGCGVVRITDKGREALTSLQQRRLF